MDTVVIRHAAEPIGDAHAMVVDAGVGMGVGYWFIARR